MWMGPSHYVRHVVLPLCTYSKLRLIIFTLFTASCHAFSIYPTNVLYLFCISALTSHLSQGLHRLFKRVFRISPTCDRYLREWRILKLISDILFSWKPLYFLNAEKKQNRVYMKRDFERLKRRQSSRSLSIHGRLLLTIIIFLPICTT